MDIGIFYFTNDSMQHILIWYIIHYTFMWLNGIKLKIFSFSHGDGWQMDFTAMLPQFYALMKQEAKGGKNTGP